MITRTFGLSLSPPIYSFLLVFIFLGIAAIVQGYPVYGAIAITVGILPLFSVTGAQTDPEKKRFREFTGLFGIKVGRWYSYEEFPELVVLKCKSTLGLKWGYSGAQIANEEGFSGNTIFSKKGGASHVYELFAMDVRHNERIKIDRSDSKEEHEEMCRKMSEVTGLPWMSYSPYGRFAKKRMG